MMMRWKRATVLGFLSWLIPFALSIVLFPLKRSNAPLFETLMPLVVLFTAIAMFQVYFRNRTVVTREAVLVGAVWLVFNVALDYPMFAYGPMKMTAWNYYSDIGLGYLIFPAFAFGATRLSAAVRL
jgi:hypothetical protein